MYRGFLVIKYGMMTNTKSTAFEEKFITYSSREEETHQATQALWGSTRISQETVVRRAWPRTFTVVSARMNE